MIPSTLFLINTFAGPSFHSRHYSSSDSRSKDLSSVNENVLSNSTKVLAIL